MRNKAKMGKILGSFPFFNKLPKKYFILKGNTMKMQLSILERIVLMGVLPAEGDIVTLRLVSDARKDISFSDKEMRESKIVNNPQNGQISWDEKAAKDKEIDIPTAVIGIVKTKLLELNEKKKLNGNHISLYEKFVEAVPVNPKLEVLPEQK